MGDDTKNKRTGSLKERVEKIHIPSGEVTGADTALGTPEEFVKPLVEQVMKTRLPEIDLTNREGAQVALEMLGSKLAELQKHRDQVQKLKSLLQQKKFDLENS